MAEAKPHDPTGLSGVSDSSESGLSTPMKQQKESEKTASSDHGDSDHGYPSGLPLYLTLTSVTLAYFLLFLDIAIISTATPAITSHFDSLVDVGW